MEMVDNFQPSDEDVANGKKPFSNSKTTSHPSQLLPIE
jgi:hypothetical protein